jgi:hypothetical protein
MERAPPRAVMCQVWEQAMRREATVLQELVREILLRARSAGEVGQKEARPLKYAAIRVLRKALSRAVKQLSTENLLLRTYIFGD